MRALRTPHAALPSYTTADALFLLRCDEAGGANNLTDALALRTMTQALSPDAALSPFNDNSQAAGRGARTFDGATQFAGRAASDNDHTMLQTLAWGFACWIQPTSLATTAIVEYGEWSSPETQATNVQMAVDLLSNGGMRMFWENGAGVNVTSDTPAGLIAANVATHIGWACEPDPSNHQKARLRAYINGECVAIFANVAVMDGGTTARWIVAASRNGGTAVGTPGAFFPGAIDDAILVTFSPKHEWFREAYANGACAFYEKNNNTADNQGVAANGGLGSLQEVHTRVLIEVATDGSAWPTSVTPLALRNLTDLDLTNIGGLGFDLVKSVEFGDNIDDRGPSASIDLITRFDFLNISPVDDLSILQTLLQQRRRVKIEQAYVPIGTTRDGADPYYRLMFDGWAWNPDISPMNGRLEVLGPHAPLDSAWIEPAPSATADQNSPGDRLYGSAGGTAVETCMQNIIDDHDPARFVIVPATGAEGVPNGIAPATGTPPQQIQIRVFGLGDEHAKGRPHAVQNADPLLIAGTTNYNGIKTANASTTTTVIQCAETSSSAAEQAGTVSMLPIHGYKGGKPSVWTPTSPSWNLFVFYEPPSKSVFGAIQAWADEIGWACRFRWDDTRKQFRLKLYDPRASPSIATMLSDQLYMPESVKLKHDYQRTAGLVEYASNANKDSKAERVRYCVGFGDLARNGDRYYFRVVNDAKSLITDSTAAQKELDTLKADLGGAPSSNADAVSDFPPDPRWDVGDGLDILSEYATAPSQMPAVFGYESFPVVNGYRTRAERGKVRLQLTLGKFGGNGGAGTARRDVHHANRLAPIGRKRGLGLGSPTAPAAPTIINLAALNATRCALVTWSFPVSDQNRGFDIMEVHYSTTTGFTPSSSTLKATVRGTLAMLTGFVAATVYFVKIVATDKWGNRSAASAQASFTS